MVKAQSLVYGDIFLAIESTLVWYCGLVQDSQDTSRTVAGAVWVSAKRRRLWRSLSSAAFLAVALMCATVTCQKDHTHGFRLEKSQHAFTLVSSHWYLRVVELLDDSFTLFADVANTDKFCLTVTLKESAAYSLNHNGSGASARHAAVLNVPKDTNWRNVFRTIVLWRPWWRHSYLHMNFRWLMVFLNSKWTHLSDKQKII